MKHLSTRSLITPRTELSSLFLTGAADGVRKIKRPFLAIIPPRPREVLLRAVYDLNLVHFKKLPIGRKLCIHLRVGSSLD